MQTGSTPIVKLDAARLIAGEPARVDHEAAFASGMEILRPVRQGPRGASDRERDFEDAGSAEPQTRARPLTPPPSALWERISVSPWQAPASLTYAAQRFAQEDMAPGLHLEDFPPALRAYARAAGDTPADAAARSRTGLSLWI